MTLADLERAAEALSSDDFDDLTTGDLADAYARLTHLITHLAVVRDEAERQLLALWESQQTVDTPTGSIRRVWRSKRWVEWDNAGLQLAATNVILREVTGGDVDELQVARRTLEWVTRLFRIGGSSARPSELRSVGVDADEFARAVPGRWAAELVGDVLRRS